MKTSKLEVRRWYSFTNYEGEVNYCRYRFRGETGVVTGFALLKWEYVFRLLDERLYPYSRKEVECSMSPCSRRFSEYLDLFVTNEEVE